MQWRGRKRSGNVRTGGGSGGSFFPSGGKRKFGLGTIVIIIIISVITGTNPLNLIGIGDMGSSVGYNQSGQTANYTPPADASDDDLKYFVEVVLKETEDYWNKEFQQSFGKDYPEPQLVLYSGTTSSACGAASPRMGPFYCPADQTIYINRSFYDELRSKYGAPGDFAMAYVIAHEVGHHVQYLMGTTRKVDSQRGRVSKADYNQLSVRLELQADFFAGLWAHYAERYAGILDEGDIEEALNAAAQIGDDKLQERATGRINPESFTHGTSAQRQRWFAKGYQTGDLRQGDTFSSNRL